MGIYSKDLRFRAVAAVEQGIPSREVVETFSISLTTLKRWLRMSREGKDLLHRAPPREQADASSQPSNTRRLCGASSKRTTMLPWSAIANFGSTRWACGCRSPP